MFTQRKEAYGFQVSIKKDKLGNLQKDEKGYIFEYQFHFFAPPVEAIVFEGGGGKTTPYMALLEKIEHQRHTLKQFVGSSAGAFFAVLAAIPFQPGEIKQVMAKIEISKDVLPQSQWAILYRIITSPLYLISKPLSVTAKAAENFLQKKPGWLAKLFLVFAYVLKMLGLLTHPLIFVALYNLFVKGGLFRGEIFQTQLRDTIHDSTKLCLERFINNMPLSKQNKIINILLNIPYLITKINEKNGMITVDMATKEITLKHFYELSLIENLGFKNVVITAVRNKRLVVFSHLKKHNCPLYKAVFYSISAPGLYTQEKYMDGGCINLFPLEHVFLPECSSRFMQSYLRGEYQQDLRVLGVCPRSEKGLLRLYVAKKQSPNWQRDLAKKLCQWLIGVDVITHNEKAIQFAHEQYPLRLLQLYDHNINMLDFMVEPAKRDEIIEAEKKRVDDFFALHNKDELVHLEIFNSISMDDASRKNMPLKLQKKFLKFLQSTDTPQDKIFINLSDDVDITMLREQIVKQIENNLSQVSTTLDSENIVQMPTQSIQQRSPDETKSVSSGLLLHRRIPR